MIWGFVSALVVLGLGGRIAMSGIAIALGSPLEWSVGGTLQVIVLGAALGPPAGALYVLCRRRLPAHPVASGLVFGVAGGAALVAIYFLRPAGPVELNAAPVLSGFLFGALLLLFGVVLALVYGGDDPPEIRVTSPFVGIATLLLTLGPLALALFALISR